MPSARRNLTRRLVAPFAIALAMLVVLLEVTLWAWLTALGRQLARLPLFTALEHLVERLSPGAVIAVFVLPFVPIIPLLKLGELWLLREGHFIWAAIVILGTKIIGAAFSTRVFAIAKPKMMQVPWFAWLHDGVMRMLDFAHRTLEGIPAWVLARQAARRAAEAVRQALRQARGPLGRGFAAARRWVRRRLSGGKMPREDKIEGPAPRAPGQEP
ncbi:hypothetical protein [Sediminicoccus sp. KRV36]|uniref:hypothetical protein n=1 Tax=Sediminicoccus sp. KRV36 TaxID=3133721 RepID=UPI00201054C1|nr:hypothetical protein [Sediminicoccus rosea]UPY37190.1 hypothetical protein LHU95_00405 [Sediminicoccus rosea]